MGKAAEAVYLERDTAELGFERRSGWETVHGGNQVRSTWNIGGGFVDFVPRGTVAIEVSCVVRQPRSSARNSAAERVPTIPFP